MGGVNNSPENLNQDLTYCFPMITGGKRSKRLSRKPGSQSIYSVVTGYNEKSYGVRLLGATITHFLALERDPGYPGSTNPTTG